MTITTVTSSTFHKTSCPPGDPLCGTRAASLTYRCSRCSEQCLNCLKNKGTLPHFAFGCENARRAEGMRSTCPCLVDCIE